MLFLCFLFVSFFLSFLSVCCLWVVCLLLLLLFLGRAYFNIGDGREVELFVVGLFEMRLGYCTCVHT